MRLLIDEMLSPTLVERFAEELGIPTEHVVRLGRAGRTDSEIWSYAFEHDQTVVTMNTGDFLSLAGRSELHAGLIVIRQGGLTRDETWQLLRPAIEELKDRDLVNQVVEIYGDGSFKVRDLPEP